MSRTATAAAGPGANLDIHKMPGHWVLSRLGKKVLRPGGLELTQAMQAQLAIGPGDEVVEFAPGLGVTARKTCSCNPTTYTAVERDRDAAHLVEGYLNGDNQKVVLGTAQETGLEDACATVVYGEALLTMQTQSSKEAIVHEAARLLRPGGRYAMHEIAIKEGVSQADREELEQALQHSIRVGARPLPAEEWVAMLAEAGLKVVHRKEVPMALLEPRRMIADEGLAGTLKIMFRALTHPAARKRVCEMRRTFRKHMHLMSAILLVAQKD